MPIQQGRIDVHHHLIPPAFVQTMDRLGIKEVAGAPLPSWEPQDSIDVMNRNGIEVALLSLSAPGVWFQNEEQAVDLARSCNEYAAELVDQHPDRFGYFAVLPMPATEPSCKEAIYALDHLGADGIVLLGSTRGVFLGDPSLDELMHELNERGTTVFVHPNLHETSKNLETDLPGFLLEFLCDTSRAAVNLMLSGTMERYPNIRWILSHSGGFLPYIAHRLQLAEQISGYDDAIPDGALAYVRRFYYDTALSPSRLSQVALKELVSPSQILFGSDFPFAPAVMTRIQCRTLESLGLWSDAEEYGIQRGHALALFPEYANDQEEKTGRPLFENDGFWARTTRARGEPLASMAERMRSR